MTAFPARASTVPARASVYADSLGSIGSYSARKVDLDAVRVFHLPGWKDGDDRRRIAALRQIALEGGRDPRIATLAVEIVRGAGVEPRDYPRQAAALLRWVQHQVYYVNEPGERLQDPTYTIRVRYGDCDDMALLLAAFCESLRLPWRYVLTGKRKGQKKPVRWVEGTPYPHGVEWAHIYLAIGWPTFQPREWRWAEPTLRGVPLGWDVLSGRPPRAVGPRAPAGAGYVLPELAGAWAGPWGAAEPAGQVELPFFHHVGKEIVAKLHPRTLIPAVAVGIVSGAVSAAVIAAWKTRNRPKPKAKRNGRRTGRRART